MISSFHFPQQFENMNIFYQLTLRGISITVLMNQFVKCFLFFFLFQLADQLS